MITEQLDPTRTTTLRNLMARDVRGRLTKVAHFATQYLPHTIETKGINHSTISQITRHVDYLLTTYLLAQASIGGWWERYLGESYLKGVNRSYSDTRYTLLPKLPPRQRKLFPKRSSFITMIMGANPFSPQSIKYSIDLMNPLHYSLNQRIEFNQPHNRNSPIARHPEDKSILRSLGPDHNPTATSVPGTTHDAGPQRGLFLPERYSGIPTYLVTANAKLRDVHGRFMSKRVSDLAKRFHMELQGVTQYISQRVARALYAGMDRQDTPDAIAQAINQEITSFGLNRALVVVRTEMIRAHAEGQLDSLEALGISNVRVRAEWQSSGNACPRCKTMDGTIHTLQAARGMIPLHPNCRCAWIPHYG